MKKRRRKKVLRKKHRFLLQSMAGILLFAVGFCTMQFSPTGKDMLLKILTVSMDISEWTEKAASFLPK